jgi:Uma2 family endonuclease
MPLPKENELYSYSDRLNFPESENWELIDGIPYLQAAPSWQHQFVSVKLVGQLYNYFKDKPCMVFNAPFDVILDNVEEDDDDYGWHGTDEFYSKKNS